jgi:hypothetical protein
MSDLPPTPDPADPELADDDELDDPWHDQMAEAADDYGSPDVQALSAFVLSILSIGSFGLLDGATYLITNISAAEDYKTRAVLAAVLGAAFALLPMILGWRASARVLATDAKWVATLARTAVLLGLLSLVLRLVLAVIIAGSDDPRAGIGRF